MIEDSGWRMGKTQRHGGAQRNLKNQFVSIVRTDTCLTLVREAEKPSQRLFSFDAAGAMVGVSSSLLKTLFQF